MISLVMDTLGYFVYPATIMVIFANTLSIGIVLLTDWDYLWVKLAFYGAMVAFFFLQVFIFLLPVRSKNISGCIGIFSLIGAFMMLAIAVFLILPYIIFPNRLDDTMAQVRDGTLGGNLWNDPLRVPDPNRIPPGSQPMNQKRLTWEDLKLFNGAQGDQDDPGFGIKRYIEQTGSNSLNSVLYLLQLYLPLFGAVVIYAIALFFSSWRFRGCRGCGLVIAGGLLYVFLLPTFYVTFLIFSLCRYDVTSWRGK